MPVYRGYLLLIEPNFTKYSISINTNTVVVVRIAVKMSDLLFFIYKYKALRLVSPYILLRGVNKKK